MGWCSKACLAVAAQIMFWPHKRHMACQGADSRQVLGLQTMVRVHVSGCRFIPQKSIESIGTFQSGDQVPKGRIWIILHEELMAPQSLQVGSGKGEASRECISRVSWLNEHQDDHKSTIHVVRWWEQLYGGSAVAVTDIVAQVIESRNSFYCVGKETEKCVWPGSLLMPLWPSIVRWWLY